VRSRLARVWWTYSFLLSWVGGGIALLAMMLLRTARRPYELALAALGYGAGGFLGVGFGLGRPASVALAALSGAVLGGALGYGLGRLRRPDPSSIMELRQP
jgi:uncharacterized membrane protein YjjB (DUF3815 family)